MGQQIELSSSNKSMSKKITLDIWPSPQFNLKSFITPKRISPSEFEHLLQRKFQTQKVPVLVSSGRVGLALCLLASNLSRINHVRLFDFASTCVISSVSNVVTPICSGYGDNKLPQIIYHQWGNLVQENIDNVIVEDAIDSFCLPGAQLSPLGAKFEVWSLPKIFGSLVGGIVWCDNYHSSELVRRYRDNRREFTSLRWLIRLLSINYPSLVKIWFALENYGGPVPELALSHINSIFEMWDNIAFEREKRLNVINSIFSVEHFYKNRRYPTAVPLLLTDKQEEKLRSSDIDYRLLHYPNKNFQYTRVLPLPVHQDFPIDDLYRVVDLIQ